MWDSNIPRASEGGKCTELRQGLLPCDTPRPPSCDRPSLARDVRDDEDINNHLHLRGVMEGSRNQLASGYRPNNQTEGTLRAPGTQRNFEQNVPVREGV